MGIKNKRTGPQPNATEEWQILARRSNLSAAVRSYRTFMRRKGVEVPFDEACRKVKEYSKPARFI